MGLPSELHETGIEQETDKQMQKWHRYHHVANSGRVRTAGVSDRSSSASGVMETSRDCVHREVVVAQARRGALHHCTSPDVRPVQFYCWNR